MVRSGLCTTALIAILAVAAQAAVIHVPGDQPTIGSAVNAAARGDTVLVAPGRYAENIVITKALHLSSSGGVSETHIDLTGDSLGFGILYGVNSPADTLPLVISGFWFSGRQRAIVANMANPVAVRIERCAFVDIPWDNVVHFNGHNVTAAVINCTFVGCGVTVDADHHQIGVVSAYTDSSSVTHLINNIFYRCSTATSAYEPEGILVQYNCFADNGVDFGRNVVPMVGNVIANPLLDSSTLNLSPTSPCIDSGDPASQPDPDGTRADIGALPYQWAFEKLRVEGPDSLHVLDHLPMFCWSIVPDTGLQEGYELEIGEDEDWMIAETWASGPVTTSDTCTVHEGPPLVDGTTYFARMRGLMNGNWSGWTATMFRMNSRPSLPIQAGPAPASEQATDLPIFEAVSSLDAQGDSQQLQFSLCNPDTVTCFEQSPLVPVTPVLEGDTVSWTATTTLTENELYAWKVRAWDGYEWGDYAGPEYFWVNAVQEAPGISGPGVPDADSIVHSQLPELTWVAVTDPDPNDTVQYDLRVAQDSGFLIGAEVDSLTDTTHALTFPLETGRRYWWKVISRDNHGLTAESAVETFRTYKPGDANGSWDVSSSDIITLVNYVFKSVPMPVPECAGLVNGDDIVNASDIIYLVNYVFKGGVGPVGGCD